jgi:hypothetical protein
MKARLLLWLAAGAIAGGATVADIRLIERDRVVLKVRPLTPEAVEHELRLAPGGDGLLSLEVRWPDRDSLSRIDLHARERSQPAGQGKTIDLHADVTLPDGAIREASRTLVLEESATELFELLRSAADRSLTLAIVAEVETELTLPAPGKAGLPVHLRVEVERMEAGKATPLESNQLSTFAGEAVTYSFHIDTGDGSESLRLELLPHSINGDLLQIDLDLSGVLPAADGPMVIARKEHWLGSRGASSSVTLETGEPPTGYRFIVTPRF